MSTAGRAARGARSLGLRRVTAGARQAAAFALLVTFGAPAGAAELTGEPAAGAEVFEICAACHQVGAGAENRIGPQLNGIFGRKAASIQGFSYSDAMIRTGADGLVWDYDQLDVFLDNPKALVSRTKMNFDGLADPQERADVIAFLRSHSASPANIPESAPTARSTLPSVDPAVLAIQGDPAYGEYLSSECSTCHQVDGGDEGIPSITGWPPEDFVAAMHAYKDKHRPHPVMQMLAGRLSNEEIAALAAYFGVLQ